MLRYICGDCGTESEPRGPVERYSEVGDWMPTQWAMVCGNRECRFICAMCEHIKKEKEPDE